MLKLFQSLSSAAVFTDSEGKKIKGKEAIENIVREEGANLPPELAALVAGAFTPGDEELQVQQRIEELNKKQLAALETQKETEKTLQEKLTSAIEALPEKIANAFAKGRLEQEIKTGESDLERARENLATKDEQLIRRGEIIKASKKAGISVEERKLFASEENRADILKEKELRDSRESIDKLFKKGEESGIRTDFLKLSAETGTGTGIETIEGTLAKAQTTGGAIKFGTKLLKDAGVDTTGLTQRLSEEGITGATEDLPRSKIVEVFEQFAREANTALSKEVVDLSNDLSDRGIFKPSRKKFIEAGGEELFKGVKTVGEVSQVKGGISNVAEIKEVERLEGRVETKKAELKALGPKFQEGGGLFSAQGKVPGPVPAGRRTRYLSEEELRERSRLMSNPSLNVNTEDLSPEDLLKVAPMAGNTSGVTIPTTSPATQARKVSATSVQEPQVAKSAQGQIEGIAGFDSSTALFNDSVSRFEQAVSLIPTEISLEGNHKVEVVINGAQAFETMVPSIKELVIGEINTSISQFMKNNLKMPGDFNREEVIV